jgi:hypothetical protein
MEEVRSSETSVNFYRPTQRYIPEDSTGRTSQIRHRWDQTGEFSEPYDKKCMAVILNTGTVL